MAKPGYKQVQVKQELWDKLEAKRHKLSIEVGIKLSLAQTLEIILKADNNEITFMKK